MKAHTKHNWFYLIAVIVIVIVLLLTGCKTVVEVTPEYPEFTVITPERPVLETVQSDVPIEATRNLIKMMSYAEQLENALDTWTTFYEELKNNVERY